LSIPAHDLQLFVLESNSHRNREDATMAHRQEEEQAVRKKAGQGAVHAVEPEQLQGRSKPRVDEMLVDAPDEQAKPANDEGRAGGDQGRHDQGGQGRMPSKG
jgi:hypothetical protein